MKIVVVVVDLIFYFFFFYFFFSWIFNLLFNNTKLISPVHNIPKPIAGAYSTKPTGERIWKNLWLKETEVTKVAGAAVNIEKFAIPAFALLALPGLISSLTAAITPNNNQDADSDQNKKTQQIQSISNSALDFLSVFGEMQTRPICSIGNLIRMGVNGTMISGNDDSKRIANIFYNFASAFIAIGWGINGQPNLSSELKEKKTFFDKAHYQFKTFASFWTDLPAKLTSHLKGEKTQETALPLKTKLTKYGYFVHALLAFVSTGVLLFSNLLPSSHKHVEGEVDDAEEHYVRNSTEAAGWDIGKFSRLPLLISIFADTFNPHNFSTYGWMGSLLSFAYGISAVANMLWMQIPQVAASTDFVKNLLSNLRSLQTRYVNNNPRTK